MRVSLHCERRDPCEVVPIPEGACRIQIGDATIYCDEDFAATLGRQIVSHYPADDGGGLGDEITADDLAEQTVIDRSAEPHDWLE